MVFFFSSHNGWETIPLNTPFNTSKRTDAVNPVKNFMKAFVIA
jgi:hypothetical protein